MTREERREYTRAAQRALKENGIKVYQKDMTLLEAACSYDNSFGIKLMIVDYVMIEDRASGKTYQCYYGKTYNAELDTIWSIEEYAA